MAINKLDLVNFRSFSSVSIDFKPGINIITGNNGVGKTSILEAIYLLSTGRSFRTSNLSKITAFEADYVTVSAEIRTINNLSSYLGYSREKGRDKQITLNHQKAASISDLASILPLCCLETNAFRALLQPPQFRRQIVDWGVFHVKHYFLTAWREYNQVLRQRNTFLRENKGMLGINRRSSHLLDEIRSWDKLLARASIQLIDMREQFIQSVKPLFKYYIAELGLENWKPSLSIKSGFENNSREDVILQELNASLELDLSRGYTNRGPHRADLAFRTRGVLAKDILSRGQQKLVVIAYYLAQIEAIRECTGKRCTLLVDDLSAELDNNALNLIYKQLEKFKHQVIISTVSREGAEWLDSNLIAVE